MGKYDLYRIRLFGFAAGSIRYLCIILFVLLYGLLSLHAQAQQNESTETLEIEANGGIDWLREKKLYIARGGAVLRRGNMEIQAERIEIRYDEKNTSDGAESNNPKLARVDAFERVKIVNDNLKAYGSRGAYLVERDIAQLSGHNLRLLMPDTEITAEDSLEFWRSLSQAVARGHVVATREQNRLSGDILVAVLDGTEGQDQKIDRLEVIGNVHISTANEIIKGNEAVYHVEAQTAKICGDVSIIKGENIATGRCADIDMESGFATFNSGGDKPVKALIKIE
ncbi:MAG: LptA/OstA family protein [Pseudomonadota bacterium]